MEEKACSHPEEKKYVSQAVLILNSIVPEGMRKEPCATSAGKRAVFQLSYLEALIIVIPLQNTVLLNRLGGLGA